MNIHCNQKCAATFAATALLTVALILVADRVKNSSAATSPLLISAHQLQPDDGRIFFHETSGKAQLNMRQSCAVESAARHNPDRSVLLFMTADALDDRSSSPFLSILEQYSNVRVVLLSDGAKHYFAGTPLEDFFQAGQWRWSRYSAIHLSGYLRVLSLFKGMTKICLN